MSAENPILLVDDDEEDCASGVTESQLVPAFLEVMPHKSRDYAEKMLEKSNFNLEQALLLSLDGQDDDKRREQQATKSLVRQTVVSQSTGTSSTPSETSKAATMGSRETQTESTLDIEWHTRHDMAQSLGQVFCDSTFPPSSVSLDGRHHHQTTAVTIKCLCGIPAKSKTVQRDGPNYGRFYLCCGRGRQYSNDKKCGFFQWQAHGCSGGDTRYSLLSWHSFGPPECVLVRGNIGPEQVKQGAVGNCWFLSALAVIAERPHLVGKLLPHAKLNPVGIYQVNLCLDGKWTPVIIDSHLPVMKQKRQTSKAKPSEFRGIVGDWIPAFCDVPKGQLWPALIEKAYAKAHGSYAQLSGGFIAEALADLTGAPTETIVFGNAMGNAEWRQELWARLLSFQESKFLMGVATSRGGEGLVGGHAYSVLDVMEFNDVVVGEQQRVTDFFTSAAYVAPAKKKQRQTIRLLRIRNPWGKREWKGEWSASSDKWTTALRKRLGDKSCIKNDGTFFMAFEDVIQNFHHMDIAKCQQDWKHTTIDGGFQANATDPLASSLKLYRVNVEQRTWAFISLIQPKKRANTKTQYWYADLSLMVLKRRKDSNDSWSCEASRIQGCSRSCTSEVFLDPSYDYVCVPFSYQAQCRGGSQASPFRVSIYSSATVEILPVVQELVDRHSLLVLLQRELLQMKHKVHYAVGENALLLCIHGRECLYFVVLNAASDRYLSLRLTMDVKKGMILAHGSSGDTFDVPPRSQKLVMVALSDGTDAAAASVSFSYLCDAIATNPPKQSMIDSQAIYVGVGSNVELSMAGDLFAIEITSESASNKGGDTVETHNWLSQLGSSSS